MFRLFWIPLFFIQPLSIFISLLKNKSPVKVNSQEDKISVSDKLRELSPPVLYLIVILLKLIKLLFCCIISFEFSSTLISLFISFSFPFSSVFSFFNLGSSSINFNPPFLCSILSMCLIWLFCFSSPWKLILILFILFIVNIWVFEICLLKRLSLLLSFSFSSINSSFLSCFKIILSAFSFSFSFFSSILMILLQILLLFVSVNKLLLVLDCVA